MPIVRPLHIRWSFRLIALLALVALPGRAPLAAQSPVPTGRLSGRILTTDGGSPVAGANVSLVGTMRNATSAVDGRFTFLAVPAGPMTIRITAIGFAPKTVTEIAVRDGQMTVQDVAMVPAAVQMAEITTRSETEKGTVASALDQQRTATGIVSAITAQQMARSPDANAAQAVQRISGVTVQDGKYIFVRGLGERYTTASLNGARIPSPETERKVVPLDVFPAGLLQTITTAKTFTPDLAGDFAGAAVNIQTRDYPADPTIALAINSGYNSASTGRRLLSAPSAGGEWLGLVNASRELPSMVAEYGNTLGKLSRDQLNGVVASFRPVWSPVMRTAAPNRGGSASLGGRTMLRGGFLGYMISGSYSGGTETRENELRSQVVPNFRDQNGAFTYFNRMTGTTTRSSNQAGGVANFSWSPGETTRLAFNNLYTRSSDNEAHFDEGFLDQNGIEAPGQRTSLVYVTRSVRSNQLSLEQAFGDRHSLTLAATVAGVTRDEPDRSDFVRVRMTGMDGQYLPFAWLAGDANGARRSFTALAERSWNLAADYRLQLGRAGDGTVVKAGLAYRPTVRDVDNRIYSITGRGISDADARLAPEEIFDGRYTQAGGSILTPSNNSSTGAYRADDKVTAGYAMLDLPLRRGVRLVAGVRAERWQLRLDQDLPFVSDYQTPERDDLDVLPALALNVSLTERANLRLSATRTLARPEYREISLTSFCDMIAERCTTGNPDLQRSRITNLDARWEWYPREGEVVSAAVFTKSFDRPIERIEVASSGASSYSFVNTRGAKNYGLELEARKRLDFIQSGLENVTLFANGTLMHSRIDVGNDSISALTSRSRAMAQQAPWVLNAGATWATEHGTSVTLLYAIAGRRLVAVGSIPVPDTFEEARPSLDLSLQLPLVAGLSTKVNGRNLLDAEFRQTTAGLPRLSYRTGRVLQLGFTWQP